MWDEPRAAGEKRRQWKVGGFKTKKEAEAHLASVLASLDKGTYVQPDRKTLEHYLVHQWLPSLTVRATTKRSYEGHVRNYLIPHLGHLSLQKLSRTDLRLAFSRISTQGEPPPSSTTVRRIHATLRGALNAALVDDLILRNPAVGLKLAAPSRAEMEIWDAEAVGGFLRATATDRLHPLYHLLALTGMRRGEAMGLRWADVDFEGSRVSIRQQVIQNGRSIDFGPPKTSRGKRSVALDVRSLEVLRAVRARQAAEKLAWGPAYDDLDLVFAKENGASERPDHVSAHFALLVEKHGLPPVRLHDLRHSHASVLLGSGVPAKAVSERLGHSSITLTLDTYSHVLPALEEEAAVRAANAIFGTTL